MNYTFNNEGKPYTFYDDHCGGRNHLSLDYRVNGSFNIRGVSLIDNGGGEKQGFFKMLFSKKPEPSQLILRYQTFSKTEGFDRQVIIIEPQELEAAREVEKFLSKKLNDYQEYEKQFEEDNRICSMEEVPVRCPDGSIIMASTSSMLDEEDKCLYCNGDYYHTSIGCFKNWTVEERKGFNGYDLISIEDAKKRGLKYCRYCASAAKYTLADLGRGKKIYAKSKNVESEKYLIQSKRAINATNVKRIRKEFVAIDLETTGLSSSSDRIIEIGAARFVGGTLIDSFSLLVNPEMHIPEAASRVNKITDEMVADAHKEKEALVEFIQFMGDAMKDKILVGAHNASFDLGFLESAMERNGLTGKIGYIDTLTEARKIIPDSENHKLQTLASRFGIESTNAHRAKDDAEVCGKLLLELVSCFEKN
ncbi:MAG: 3'-5' exonuclease [Eubacterium sp.]|nr:3'-5' exonuclease [Eubacterium sp.]